MKKISLTDEEMNYIQLQQSDSAISTHTYTLFIFTNTATHTHTQRGSDLSGDSGADLLGLSPAGSDPISEQTDRQIDRYDKSPP